MVMKSEVLDGERGGAWCMCDGWSCWYAWVGYRQFMCSSRGCLCLGSAIARWVAANNVHEDSPCGRGCAAFPIQPLMRW